MEEHVLASCLLFNDRLCLLGDELILDDLEHFSFGLRLEPVIRVRFLMLERLIYIIQIFRAIAVRIPKQGLLIEILFRVLQEWFLEFLIIRRQVLITLPQELIT